MCPPNRGRSKQTIANLKTSLEAVESRLSTVEQELKDKSAALLEEIEKRSKLEGELKAIKELGISDQLGQQILAELSSMNKALAAAHGENKVLLETLRNLEIQDLTEGKTRRPHKPTS